jgi:hypothetical protein
MLYGIKYTKERLEYLGIKVSLDYNKDTLRPILIVEGNDGCFVVYPTNMININDNGGVDSFVDKFLSELRKEKLQKLNEVQT